MNKHVSAPVAASPLGPMFSTEHELFRQTARKFIDKEMDPHYKAWEKAEIGFPKDLFKKAAAAGLVGLNVPEAYGGPGCDELFSVVLAEECGRSLSAGALGGCAFSSDLMTLLIAQFGTEEQKHRYFPRILAGELIQCIGISEPDAGSDVNAMKSRARRDGDDYLISGQKIFISGGMHADLCFLVCRTDKDVERGRGAMSMFLVDTDNPKLQRRRMDTLGVKASSVAELFFDDMRVPATAMLGEEGSGLGKNLHHFFIFDRVVMAMRSLALAEFAFDMTVEYTKNRKVFGRSVFEFQNTQFKLAELKAELVVARPFRDMLVNRFVEGTLDNLAVSAAKLWISELEYRIVDTCLQLHGGYGYMNDTPISSFFTHARLERIYGGTNEIQKGLIARYL